MKNDDERVAISIGAITGGVQRFSRDWGAAAMAISRRVTCNRDGVETPLALNVVFHIPGEVIAPEFEGVRTGRYSKNNSELLVQVAIPDMPLPGDVDGYLFERIREAITEAEKFGHRRKLFEGHLDELRALVERIQI